MPSGGTGEAGALALRCRGVHRVYGAITALAGLDLVVAHGALTTVLGPSGCGKTTLLRLIAGFERPDRGTIELDGRVVADDGGPWVAARERAVGMVFQDYALFLHLDVAGNVAYGLGRHPDRRRVDELLDLVGLPGFATRWPQDLSGGQRQRVALARALAPRPRVVLLDEPFSNIDARLRLELRRELRTVLRETGASALLVTHDQDEALGLADRLALMHAGHIEQVGTPEEVYGSPVSRWAAEFLGQVNVLPGAARAGIVETELGPLGEAGPHRGPVEVLVRPEALAVDAEGLGPPSARPGVVVDREYFGRGQVVRVVLDGSHTRLTHWRSGPGARFTVMRPAAACRSCTCTTAPGSSPQSCSHATSSGSPASTATTRDVVPDGTSRSSWTGPERGSSGSIGQPCGQWIGEPRWTARRSVISGLKVARIVRAVTQTSASG